MHVYSIMVLIAVGYASVVTLMAVVLDLIGKHQDKKSL